MNEQTELSLDGFWIRPHSYVTYLDELVVITKFKNNSDQIIEIDTVTCSFEPEDSLPTCSSSASPMISLMPNHRSSLVKIPFVVDLKLREFTNNPTLEVTYSVNKSSTKTLKFCTPYTRCIIINPMHPPEKHFFLSHKDPKDTLIATRLNHHLIKIGFIGYVAEDNPRPGFDIWDEKISPSIDTCVGIIVLWTSDAAADPQRIIREVKYAKKKGKRVILLAEKNVDIPDLFQGTKEYLTTESKISNIELVKLVEVIEKIYDLGGFEN